MQNRTYVIARKCAQSAAEWKAVVGKLLAISGVEISARGRSQVKVEIDARTYKKIAQQIGDECIIEPRMYLKPA